MWRRRAAALQMARLIETPTGNVRLTLPMPAAAADDLALAASGGGSAALALVPAPSAGWSIRDGEGRVVASDLESRAAALRMIGIVALHGHSAPYEVLDPSGRPTGDRLS